MERSIHCNSDYQHAEYDAQKMVGMNNISCSSDVAKLMF